MKHRTDSISPIWLGIWLALLLVFLGVALNALIALAVAHPQATNAALEDAWRALAQLIGSPR